MSGFPFLQAFLCFAKASSVNVLPQVSQLKSVAVLKDSKAMSLWHCRSRRDKKIDVDEEFKVDDDRFIDSDEYCGSLAGGGGSGRRLSTIK